MDLMHALAEDVLAVIPSDGPCKPTREIVRSVAPLREKEVRAVIRDLDRRGLLDKVPAGNIWQAYYRQKPSTGLRLRRI